MTRSTLALTALGLLGLLATGSIAPAVAQVSAAPALLNYQGRLATPSGNPVSDGTYSIRFSLWDAVSGGTEKWNQTIAGVQVKNGTFAVLLNTNTAGLFNGNLWLETKIGSDAALAPRQQLVSVAYAMKANSVPDASIGTAQITDGAITSAKLATGAITPLAWLLSGNSITNAVNQFIGTISNQPLAFRTNNAEKMRLDTFGNLGIGTTNPATKLHVQNGSIRIGNTEDNKNYELAYDATDNYFYIDEFGVGRHFTIKNGGNVGIGTTTPAAKLDVNGTVAVAGNAAFASNATVAGNASVTGNVGIGTTSPTYKLEVRNGNAAVTNASGAIRVINGFNPTSDSGYIQISAGSSAIAGLGGTAAGGQFFARNAGGTDTILLDGGTGEVTAKVVTVLGGSDVAEPYHVAPAGAVKPIAGMLVCIDEEKVGQMRVAAKAYDSTVAGIISGANGINPGITLRQKGTVADGELPVASIGRVWCYCDADANGAIKAGDMLTTSDTPGHAMKITDFSKANGTVIGKAMSSLKSGKGLVLVLVSLK